ncbi:MAG TPA: hypothetical protein VMI35_00030 [Puia sp.]|nr:hypothetical protein [Puia sp.]
MESKTKIILSRPSQWMNRARSYSVFIDGSEVGKIRNGSSEEFLVNPGQHEVYCKLAWYSSPVFALTVEPGRVEYIRVKSGMKYYWPLFFVLVVGLIINLFFSREPGQRPSWIWVIQLVFILPSILYMFYYLTLGRRNYLRVEEDRDNVFAS